MKTGAFAPSEPVWAWPEDGSGYITAITSTNMSLDTSFTTIEGQMPGIVLFQGELGEWDAVWVLWEDGRILLTEARDMRSML